MRKTENGIFVVPPPFSVSINLKRKRRRDRADGGFAPATPVQSSEFRVRNL